MLPPLDKPYEDSSFAETPAIFNSWLLQSSPSVGLLSLTRRSILWTHPLMFFKLWTAVRVINKNWLLKHRNRTYLMNGYEPSPDLTCRQLLNFKELEIGLGVFYWILYHPTNRVYHALTPQPRSFLRELPTLGVFWLFTLHQSVFIVELYWQLKW